MVSVLTHPLPTHLYRPSYSPCAFISDGARDTLGPEPPELQIIVATPAASGSQLLPSLPAELHLEIVDIITRCVPRTPSRDESYDPRDLNTLCTCALVCKLWLNIARRGIWADTRLSGKMKSMAFVRLLRAYGCESGDAPLTQVPSFGCYVSHLSVRETRGNAWDPKWLDDTLPHLAAHLPCVQSLEMERVTWEYLSSRSRTACLEAFKHAKSLTLRGFVFHTTKDMYDFLGEFTELEVLTLDGVHCAKRDTPTRFLSSELNREWTTELPPRGLKEVGFRGVSMEPVLEWITAGANYQRELGKTCSRIKSVRVGGVGVSEANIVGRFLKGLGDSLREVHIGFETDFIERGDALVREMELAENTNLEELHVFGLVVPSPPPADPFEPEETPPPRALGALTMLLSQIRSRMRVLSLALYPADVRAMSTIDFEGLNRVFEKRVWSCVEEVRVVISNKGERGLGQVARERLGVLDERRVLKVNVGFDEREVL